MYPLKINMNIETCFNVVYSMLGAGFSESVYHRAIEVYLRTNFVEYQSEVIIPIEFYKHTIGNVRLDLIIDKKIIVEIKAIVKLNDAARIQIRNYMRLTGHQLAYLVNFPQTLEYQKPEIELIDLRLEMEESST